MVLKNPSYRAVFVSSVYGGNKQILSVCMEKNKKKPSLVLSLILLYFNDILTMQSPIDW